MNQAFYQQLAEQFAPQVYLAKYKGYVEEYFPTNVEWYLQRVSLQDRDDSGFKIDKPSATDLIQNNGRSKYLEPKDKNKTYLGDLASAVMYAHIRPAVPNIQVSAQWVDIQYWFLYAYDNSNSPIASLLFSHEADWEHITVRVSDWKDLKKAKIRGVYYARHAAEGAWTLQQANKPADGYYTLVKDTQHPIVYSAWNSHASYENPGLHTRLIPKLGVGSDLTGAGQIWQPDNVQLISVADSLDGGATIQDAAWLDFKGRWGSTLKGFSHAHGADSPRSPKQHEGWNDDGEVGYTAEMEEWAEYGDQWSSGRQVTDIAIGRFAALDKVVAVTTTPNQSNGGKRFYLFNTENLTEVASGGNDWGNERTATGVAIGSFHGREALAISRTSNDSEGPRFYIYDWDSTENKFRTWYKGGEDWGKERDAVAIAYGPFDNKSCLAVARTSHNQGGARFYLYAYDADNDTFTELASGAKDWGDSRDATDIAFGILNETAVVGVSRTSVDSQGRAHGGERFFIYQWQDNKLKQMAAAGDDWDATRNATAIAFGALNGNAVVGVGRSHKSEGTGNLFYLYSWDDEKGELNQLAGSGSDFPKGADVTDIAFGLANGFDAVAVTINTGIQEETHDRVFVYIFNNQTGKLQLYAQTGANWGKSRYATALTFGKFDEEMVLAVGRNAANNSRLKLYHWEMPT